MRQDKAASLRERLRQGVSNFDFDALIGGVSAGPDESDAHVVGPGPQAAAHPPLQTIDAGRHDDSQGLTAALNSLGDRLLHETGKLAAAFRGGDIAESAYYFAKVNEVLELLCAVDPTGDLARRHHTVAAPPPGLRWPAPAWCLYDFAESPLSGLLPPEADDRFSSAVLAAAARSPEA